jgi:hypothetical protein
MSLSTSSLSLYVVYADEIFQIKQCYSSIMIVPSEAIQSSSNKLSSTIKKSN